MKRNNIKRKVNRVNKIVSSAICVSFVASCIAGYAFWKDGNNIEEKPLEEVDSDFEFIIETPEVVEGISLDEDNTFVDYENEIENEINEEKQVLTPMNLEPDYYFDFEYEDRSGTDKAEKTKELYYNVINKYSNMFGVPTNLMVAVATQESGIHDTSISDGGGYGLFQIQAEGNWNWLGKEISAYNFETCKNESLTICLDSNNCIDKNMLSDLEYNTKIACMIMAYNLKLCNYDIIQTIQVYNSGTGVINLEKNYGEDWVNHRENLPGDPKYLEHVLSYIDPADNILNFYDRDNNSYTVSVNNVYKELSLYH